MAELPKGESLRRAVRWISSRLDEDPAQDPKRLVNDATLRFDLTPREAEYLFEFYRGAKRAPEDA